MQLTELPGIGNKIATRFQSLGIHNARDLIFLLPRAYQDRTHPQLIPAVNEGQFATIRGQIMSISERGYRSRKTLEVMVTDGHGIILLKWFRFGRWFKANLEKKYPPGTQVLASGRVASFSSATGQGHNFKEISELLCGKCHLSICSIRNRGRNSINLSHLIPTNHSFLKSKNFCFI